MGALLESDVCFTHKTHRSQLSHYQKPTGPSLTARGQTTRHPPGVGTSRSALLLTVRVESGIARTKSNNGPRSWLCSFPRCSRHFAAAGHKVIPCERTTIHSCDAHLPASLWPPTVAWLVWVGEGGVAEGGGGGGGRL